MEINQDLYTKEIQDDGSIVFTPKKKEPEKREPQRGDVFRSSEGSLILVDDEGSYTYLDDGVNYELGGTSALRLADERFAYVGNVNKGLKLGIIDDDSELKAKIVAILKREDEVGDSWWNCFSGNCVEEPYQYSRETLENIFNLVK